MLLLADEELLPVPADDLLERLEDPDLICCVLPATVGTTWERPPPVTPGLEALEFDVALDELLEPLEPFEPLEALPELAALDELDALLELDADDSL